MNDLRKQYRDGSSSNANDRQPAFIVWRAYQRRSEILSRLLCSTDPVYFPHYFRGPFGRQVDYLIKLYRTILYLCRNRPIYVILQAPPLFAAFAAIVTGTPYVIDAHNGLIQGFWSKIPLTQLLLDRAAALVAHNCEIASSFARRVSCAKTVVIQDPIQQIYSQGRKRLQGQILFICSFDCDEPVEIILSVIRALPDYQFAITANIKKLSLKLRIEFQRCPNLQLPGFLKTSDYHALLTSSQAAVVLSTMPSVQPSGAVEALSSDTPLIVSRSTLTETLFGQWATLCDNDLDSVVKAIRGIQDAPLDLHAYRARWNGDVAKGIADLGQMLRRLSVARS